MSLLETIGPADATGETAATYRAVREAVGFVPNALVMYSTNPVILRHRWEEISYFLHHPTLSGKLLACIRLLVSVGQRCDYCIGLNTGMLVERFGVEPVRIDAMRKNPEEAPLDPKEKALLLFVVRAVADSNGVPTEALAELPRAGCTDREIFDALTHGAQQVAGDIMLNALRVENDF